MSTFWAFTCAETYKLTRRTRYYVFPALLFLLYALIQIIPGRIEIDSMSPFARLRVNFGDASGLALGAFLLKAYLPLLAFIGACDLFAGELKQKSVRSCVMLPVGRVTLFLSKCAAIFLVAVLPVFALVFVDTVIGYIPGLNALGGHLQLLMLTVDLVPFLCVIAYAAFISLIVRSPGFSQLLCIVIYIALLALGFAFSVSSCLFTGYLSWHTLIVGYALPFGALLARVLCVLGYLLAFLASDCLLFERLEL